MFPEFLALSPRLDTLAWLEFDPATDEDQVHLTTASGDSVVTTLPSAPRGRCGSADDSRRAAFTAAGNLLFVLEEQLPQFRGVAVLDGTQVRYRLMPEAGGWQAPASGPFFPLWSPNENALYYRRADGVWRWTPSAGAQLWLPGVSWWYPTISPDGRFIAYALRRSDSLHDVYLADLSQRGAPAKIGVSRTMPFFLNSTQLWYRTEAQGICGPGGDKPMVYDLTDGAESPSVVQQPLGVWPGTSSLGI